MFFSHPAPINLPVREAPITRAMQSDANGLVAPMKPVRRIALGTAIAAYLLGVFYLYGRPDFLVQLSQQIWACF